jgi:hypothetical protein
MKLYPAPALNEVMDPSHHSGATVNARPKLEAHDASKYFDRSYTRTEAEENEMADIRKELQIGGNNESLVSNFVLTTSYGTHL